ncbi:hypothetical protein RclHR1_22500003 [Rhizophagus clarus]|uniref:DNA-directed DNA polymerase n=1 Tax=Rhizophagus clarus TaxID=94130 RepID=A0A2Z6RNS5_9GLOM|nr:hypothetical protein RclHR1_22500003 [Rhizophagus clarus]
MRDLPVVSGECGNTNDCLYQCLKMAYGSYSNMPQKRLARSIAINIVGDHTYISKSPAQRRITLTLTNGHYSLILNPDRKHPSFECKRPKKPITYQENEVKDTVLLYNGKDIKSITVQQFQKLKFSKNYPFVSAKRQESLEKAYIRINAERDAFLLETKKLGLPIDISLLDWDIKKTALWLFEKLSVGIPINEPLNALEAIQQSALNFSIGKGKFQILKNFTNYRGYSHFGIFHATLGLQITLIQNGAPNALIYEKKTRIQGRVIFGEYVDFLFKIKNQGGIASQVAKRILNTLWGALCQRKKTYKTLITSSKSFDFPDGELLDSIVPIGEGQWRFQFTNPGNSFKDKVRRIHTDGFILEEDINNSPLYICSKDAFKTLKVLKFEKEGECHVKNVNQVVYDLYNRIPKKIPPRRKLNENEAEDILAELLSNKL